MTQRTPASGGHFLPTMFIVHCSECSKPLDLCGPRPDNRKYDTGKRATCLECQDQHGIRIEQPRHERTINRWTPEDDGFHEWLVNRAALRRAAPLTATDRGAMKTLAIRPSTTRQFASPSPERRKAD